MHRFPVDDLSLQAISVIVGSLAILVTVAVAVFQRHVRRFSYDVIIAAPLFTVREGAAGRLKLYFDQQNISDATLLLIRLINSGTAALLPADFIRPVTLTFANEGRLLSAEVVSQSPSNLNVAISTTPTSVSIVPNLFNASDNVLLKCLISAYAGLEVDGRIVGVGSIKRARPLEGRTIVMLTAGLAMLAVAAQIIFSGHPAPPAPRFQIHDAIMIAAFVGGYLLVVFALAPVVRRLIEKRRASRTSSTAA